jgi:hypothetical protein
MCLLHAQVISEHHAVHVSVRLNLAATVLITQPAPWYDLLQNINLIFQVPLQYSLWFTRRVNLVGLLSAGEGRGLPLCDAAAPLRAPGLRQVLHRRPFVVRCVCACDSITACAWHAGCGKWHLVNVFYNSYNRWARRT